MGIPKNQSQLKTCKHLRTGYHITIKHQRRGKVEALDKEDQLTTCTTSLGRYEMDLVLGP